MAFLSATIRPGGYVNLSDANGTPIAIQITGEIRDDAIPGVLVDTYLIEGADFANLPPANPATDGTPTDPRYQTIMTLVKQHVQAVHAAWVAATSASVQAVAKSATETAALPVITAADLGP